MTDTREPWLDQNEWNSRVYTGHWTSVEKHHDVLEPATGQVLTRIGMASPSDVAAAAAAARAAQVDWAETSYDERAALLRRVAALFEQNKKEITGWIVREAGAVRPRADFELGLAVKAANEASCMPSQPQGIVLPGPSTRISLARRVPLGVVGVISPFNFPVILAMRAVAPALAMGNAVVLKPDPRTSVCGGFILAKIFEEAGLPSGVLSVLPGAADAGEALCRDPNVAMIQFTGSTAAGRKVGELAGRHLKKVSLELGGKNSLIVLDDADLDLAASNAAWGAYLHQGQICMSSGRILVQEKVADALGERLAAKAKHLRCGDPNTDHVAIGPLISQGQLDHAKSIVDATVEAGAKLLAGGTYDGLVYHPTVLTGVTPTMRAFQEEMFGPVASVTTFRSDDEAVSLANDTDYGLSAGIISRSVGRALAIGNRLRVGLLHINDQTVADEIVHPFGGFGASGNGTSIGGPANWEEFSQWQWVTIKEKAPIYPF